jgi:hypothetical protein
MIDEQYLLLRPCMRPPIPEIFHAAWLMDRAVGAHVAGDNASASSLFREASLPEVRAWTESLWGSSKKNPGQEGHIRSRQVDGAPPYLKKEDRTRDRMPTPADCDLILRRDGWNCVFCGIPVVSKRVREAAVRMYPDDISWGRSNLSQHSAFQCMWLQFDHILPHSRGGDNSVSNVVISCAPCNFGRMEHTLDEVGIIDPRLSARAKTSWDGLERLAPSHTRSLSRV